MAQRGFEIADLICEFRHRTQKTVCIAWPLAPSGIPERLRMHGIHNFLEYERAIATLGRLQRHVDDALRPARARVASKPFDWDAAVGKVSAGAVISEHDCHRILSAAGIAAAAGELVASAKDAAAAATRIGLPVAMKGISAKVTHRAAAGLIRLNIDSATDASAAYDDLARTAERSGISLDGVYVQHMVDGGLEVLISAFRDPVFGPMISVGAGGALTELIDDVVIAPAPIAEDDLVVLLERLRLVRSALKGRNAPDLASLARYAAEVSRLATSAPWRQFVLEINPVKWSLAGVVAVDGLLIVEAP
jgi:acyl-CoA synthetase (NDP forming)